MAIDHQVKKQCPQGKDGLRHKHVSDLQLALT